MKKSTIKVGDRVKLTALFLRSTGQSLGDEGTKVWRVTSLDGSFAVVDEPYHDPSYFSAEELTHDPTLAYRRINTFNLRALGTVDASDIIARKA